MGFLYVNSKGIPWRKHSYSSGNLFDRSPYAYYLQKIEGWKERDNKARFLFGKALEQSIEFYHDNNGVGAVEDFERRWLIHAEDKTISYTKVEKDWQTLLMDGIDMIRLYMIRQPSLPIPLGGASVFQREYAKEVYPGDPIYGEIEDAGKLDIVCYVQPDHPSLEKVDWLPGESPLRPLIVDIKTAAQDLAERPGMAAFDLQLRRYSWQSGIRDVSLLWFKKCARAFQKGSSVTLLEDAGVFKAGQEAVIAKTDGEEVWLVWNDFMITEMELAQGINLKGKTDQTDAAKERAMRWLQENGVSVQAIAVTKQRLQFNSGYVTVESARDAGLIAARQIVQIVNAWKTKSWPNTFGIRYPCDDTSDPYFQAFVLNDKEFKRQNFVKSDDGSFDDLFAEEEPE